MDLSISEDQQAAIDLARQILSDKSNLERLKEVEDSDDGYDAEIWAEFAKSDLLGLCLPESSGGGGYGFIESCLLLTEIGRAVTLLPYLSTVVYGAMPIVEFGVAEQRKRWLDGVADGNRILTGGFIEANADPRRPQATIIRNGDGFELRGTKVNVPYAHVADAIVVSATFAGKPALFVVDTNLDGITIERQQTTNLSPEFIVTFDGVKISADESLSLGERGAEALDRVLNLATAGLCAVANGVAQESLRTTAEYTTTRKQFDRPIGTFQAVGQRLGDGFQYRWAIELTMLQAATMLAARVPCNDEVAIAKYWAAWGGDQIGHAGLHIHGGISIDRDYAIHRYFRWAKQMAYTLGGATPQLARIGANLA